MSLNNIDVIQSTLQKSNEWFKDIMDEMGWDDPKRAYLGLRAVLHAVRDRLTPEEALHLGSQLPMLIRGFYYEGWNISDKPYKMKNRDEFLMFVRDEFPYTDVELERITHCVMRVLFKNISEGEMQDIMDIIPKDLQEFLKKSNNYE